MELNDDTLELTADKEPVDVVVLRKYQLILGILAGLLIPPTTLVAAYYHAQGAIDDKINAIQLQNVQTFAKTADMKDMSDKIDHIASDVAEIKGYLYIRKH